jgi:hypothetical protein
VEDRKHPAGPSLALMEAQARLEQLRRIALVDHPASGAREGRPMLSADRPSFTETAQQLLEKRRRQEALAQGDRASDTLRAYLPTPAYAEESPGPQEPTLGNPNIRRVCMPKGDTIKIYPSIATAMLASQMEAPGRIWLLLGHLDSQGRGWLSLDTVRGQLTGKTSRLRVCGWRRLRQLLRQGEGVFWTRDMVGRIWIRGAAKVAVTLSCTRLKGLPAAIPLGALLGGIRKVRAHLYASFYSGRRDQTPITRNVLRELTNVPGRTQRAYEKVANVRPRRNIAIGQKFDEEVVKEQVWQHGRAVFQFLDTQGKQGAPGRKYFAWHMPNSYQGPHSQCPKGRQKKINRKLRDLVTKGMRGNGRGRVERIFWPHGAAAGRAYSKNPKVDAYWQSGHAWAKRFILWRVVPCKGC